MCFIVYHNSEDSQCAFIYSVTLVTLCHLARLYNISDLSYTFSIALDFLYKNHNTTM